MKTSRQRFLLLLLGWGLVAAAAGAAHLLAWLRPGMVPLLVAGLTAGLTFAAVRVGWINEAVRALGARRIVGAHLTRFVGVYFLWLHAQGRLPAEFAYRAGWGDIAAAAGALLLLFRPAGWRGSRAFALWNGFGLLDLLVAVGTGGWLSFTHPGSMREMAGLPLTLVPLWLVPVFLSSHFLLLRWSLGKKAEGGFPGGRLTMGA